MIISLINPPYFKRCLREFRCQGTLTSREVLPPLSLAYIASVLRENRFQVKIIDCIVENLDVGGLIERIGIECPNLVVLTVSTPTITTDLMTAWEIKENNPETKICLFGTHVTVFPELVLAERPVDFVVIGEPEQTVLELCQALRAKQNFAMIKGLGWKNGGSININEKRDLIKNLDSLPFPARDLLPNNKYKPVIYRKLPFTTILSSRGCPYHCIFCCSKIMFSNVWRARSPISVVDELELVMEKFHVKEIFFNDDTFTFDKFRVQEICQLINERGLEVFWGCESRIDTVDEKTLNLMSKCGCYKITYGVESGSQYILDKLKKGITISQIRKTFEETKRVGIQANASFIIGLPWDNLRSINETIRFAKELEPDHVQFCIATPYPGTEFYEMVRNEGYLVNTDWRCFDESSQVGVIRTDELSPDEIIGSIGQAYRQFYLRPTYLLKRMTKVKTIKEFEALAEAGFSLFFR